MEQMALDNWSTGSNLSVDPHWFHESTAFTGTRNPSIRQTGGLENLLEPVSMFVGSGSILSIATLVGEFASPRNVLEFILHPNVSDVVAMRTSRDMIIFIRASLGLPITDLARVTQATRQTVYHWIDGQIPRSDSLRRLNQLYRLAKFWNEKSPWPAGKFLQYPVNRGKTLVDLLAAKTIDEKEVRSAMLAVYKLINTAQDSRKHQSIAERLRAKGFESLSEKEYQANLDVIAPAADLSDPDGG